MQLILYDISWVSHMCSEFCPPQHTHILTLEILCYLHHFGKQNMKLITNTCVHLLVCQVTPIELITTQ